MKTNLLKSSCAILLALLAVTGCKKNSDDTPSNKYQAPSMATSSQVVQVPAKLLSSTDNNAQLAASYMGMANAFAGYSAYFNVPSNAVQSQTKSSGIVYTWSYGGTTVKLTYNDDATNRYWVWYINDVKYMDCQESILGNSGSFNVYDIEKGGTAVIVYTWTKTAGTIVATMKLIGSTSYFFKISASIDSKSGTFDMYEGASESGVHIVNVTWLTNGSGSWWISYGGTSYSGTWSA
jgi:hypothetical protein